MEKLWEWVDLSEEIKAMQESVKLFGGPELEDFENVSHTRTIKLTQEVVKSYIKPDCSFKTFVTTLNEDTLRVARKLYNETAGTNPLILNLAQRSIDDVCGK